MPEDIEEEEFSETRDEAMEGLEDEEDRSGQQGGSGQSKNLQEGGQKGKVGQQGLLDGDLASEAKIPLVSGLFGLLYKGPVDGGHSQDGDHGHEDKTNGEETGL